LIEVRNLTKKYGSHTAVDDISFTIENGRIYGLLGPNGAGKSTTMNIITGCLAATSGSVTVDGHDVFEEPTEAKKLIGYLPEIPPLYTDMTVNEFLDFVGDAKGLPYDERFRQQQDIAEATGLTDVGGRLIRNLSKGYRQRVGIAQAMVGDPDIIILDEPTVGLDPKQIIEIRELIRRLGEDKTVVISSHILAEISEVCDHVIIISEGRIVADDSLAALEEKASRENGLTVTGRFGEAEAEKIIGGIPGAELREISSSGGVTKAVVFSQSAKPDDLSEAVFRAFAAAGRPLTGMTWKESTLESIFLELTAPKRPEIDLSDPANGGEDDGDGADDADPASEFAHLREEEKKKPRKKRGREKEEYKPLFGEEDGEEEE
jgi:ABC-2 type transport system ATP-binding protein